MDDDISHYSVMTGVDGQLGATLEVAPGESESGIAVVEHTLPPDRLGSPLHRHTHEDEISHVLEGELTVKQGEEVSTAEPGDTVVKPRGVWHAFWNAGSEPLRFLEIIAPGEFAGYFPEMAAALPEGGQPDEATMKLLGEIQEKYGLEIDLSSISELREEYGLGP